MLLLSSSYPIGWSIYLLSLRMIVKFLSFFQWGLIELARLPEVHAKLREELRLHLGDQDPTYDQLANGLPYLDAFTSEILRLRPAAGDVTRVVSYHIFLLDIYSMFTLWTIRRWKMTFSHLQSLSLPRLEKLSILCSSRRGPPFASRLQE